MFKPPVNVLVVDDEPANLLAYEAILQGLDAQLLKAGSGAEALRCLLQHDVAVILLDVHMPAMDGFETATLIRQRNRSQFTPLIFITAAYKDDASKFAGYALVNRASQTLSQAAPSSLKGSAPKRTNWALAYSQPWSRDRTFCLARSLKTVPSGRRWRVLA